MLDFDNRQGSVLREEPESEFQGDYLQSEKDIIEEGARSYYRYTVRFSFDNGILHRNLLPKNLAPGTRNHSKLQQLFLK